jgi:hypothetical protein
MAHTQLIPTPRQTIVTKLVLLPYEEDDFETLSVIEDVRMEVWNQASTLEGYTVQMESDGIRDAGIILLISEILSEAITHEDIVKTLFQAGMNSIGVLAKHRHVKKIEMTLDGDSIHVEDADQATVQRLIDVFEANHPGKAATFTLSSSLQIVSTVSKEEPTTSNSQISS